MAENLPATAREFLAVAGNLSRWQAFSRGGSQSLAVAGNLSLWQAISRGGKHSLGWQAFFFGKVYIIYIPGQITVANHWPKDVYSPSLA